MEEDVNIQAESSPHETETGVTSAALSPDAQNPDVNAESSNADGEGPKSLADAVLAVVQPTEEPTTDAQTEQAPKTEEQPFTEEKPPVELPQEVTEEELSAYTPNAQKRIQTLVAERNAVRSELETIKPQLDFVREHQIPETVVQFGLNLAAALNYGDHETIIRAIEPLMNQAQIALGRALPPDLQKQVDQGYVTKELAVRTAQQEAQNRAAQARMEQLQRQQEEQQVQQRQMVVRGAVQTWESELRKSDPDFAKKEKIVQKYAAALVGQYGVPTDPDMAVRMAQEAYRMAGEDLKAAMPVEQPRATRPRASSINSVGGSVTQTPTSLKDAVMKGLRQAS